MLHPTRLFPALFAATLITTPAAAAPAAAAPLSVSATPARVIAGGSMQIKYVVKRAPAKLVLRLDRKQLRTVRVRKARGRVAVVVPPGTAAGAHRLTVCAGKACRTVKLTVVRRTPAAAPAGAPAAPSTPAPGAAE